MSQALNIKNLHVSYHGNEVLHDISLSLNSGRLIGIIGPNGAGKSTLLKAVLGLIPIDKGEVKLYEKPLKEMRKDIAYVPQRSNIDWDFPIIVKDTVLLGTYPRLGLFHRPKQEDKDWAMECLTKVGMEKYADSQISELSGGQQQRVAIARALANKPKIIFADEPTGNLDSKTTEEVMDLLESCVKNFGQTLVMITHNDDIANMADTVITIKDGTVLSNALI